MLQVLLQVHYLRRITWTCSVQEIDNLTPHLANWLAWPLSGGARGAGTVGATKGTAGTAGGAKGAAVGGGGKGRAPIAPMTSRA